MIYLDNAATSWPKANSVYDAVIDAMKNKAGNPGRSGHRMSIESGRLIEQARFSLSKLFNISEMNRIVFTLNATDALNLAINGILRPGDHVIMSSMEHNSVTRPIEHLKSSGIEYTKIPMDPVRGIDVGDVKNAIKDNTTLVVMTHASNVTGTINPIADIAGLCRNEKIFFLVDASQSAGCIDIDIDKTGIDMLAFPGHKSLLGPMGTGGLYIAEEISLMPSRYGGTGVFSEMPLQPKTMPFYYESGTNNVPGLAGLHAGVEFILNESTDKIRKRENKLVDMLMDGLDQIDNVMVYGPAAGRERAPAVSLNIKDMDCADVATILDTSFGIAVRSGLHCAPDAHRTIGTFDMGGTVRISPGYFNTEKDIKNCLDAIQDISES